MSERTRLGKIHDGSGVVVGVERMIFVFSTPDWESLGWRFGATGQRAACRRMVGFGSSVVCSRVVTIAEVDEWRVVSMLR